MREFRSGSGLEALVTRMGAEAVVLLLRKLSGARPSSQPWVISPPAGQPRHPLCCANRAESVFKEPNVPD